LYKRQIKGRAWTARIEEFKQQFRIDRHADISGSSIYRMMKEIKLAILRYRELVEQQLKRETKEQLNYLEVVLGLDETWLDNMLLVCQDLSSGYLFLNRQPPDATPKAGTPPCDNASKPLD